MSDIQDAIDEGVMQLMADETVAGLAAMLTPMFSQSQ